EPSPRNKHVAGCTMLANARRRRSNSPIIPCSSAGVTALISIRSNSFPVMESTRRESVLPALHEPLETGLRLLGHPRVRRPLGHLLEQFHGLCGADLFQYLNGAHPAKHVR